MRELSAAEIDHLRRACRDRWRSRRGRPGFTAVYRGGPFDGLPARLTAPSYPMGCVVGECVAMPHGPHVQILYKRTFAGWFFHRASDTSGIVSGSAHAAR